MTVQRVNLMTLCSTSCCYLYHLITLKLEGNFKISERCALEAKNNDPEKNWVKYKNQ